MTEWLLVVFGIAVVITTWLVVRQRQASEDLDLRKRAAGLGTSRLGRDAFWGDPE